MPNTVNLTPGTVTLSVWRRIFYGAGVSLDPACRPAIEASAATVASIIAKGDPVYGINTGFGKLASVRIVDADLATLQTNLVMSHAVGVGQPLPINVVRLMMALKINGLAQGASGIRWSTLQTLLGFLQRDLIPVVPEQGSVGASGDLAPLAHMTASLMGTGEIFAEGERRPAMEAIKAAGLKPLELGPKEGLALLNGTQTSTALALAALFETERIFQAALITGALTTDAAKGSDAPFDPRIHALRRHQGQRDVADTLRKLLEGSTIRASHIDCTKVQDPYCLRCQPQVMGACLDILRQARATLENEANAVSDNPLVFAKEGDVISGGNFHAEPVAFAADIIALALCEIGSIAERRTAMLVDPTLSGLPAFLTPRPGLNSGFMMAQVTAAALVSENKQRAMPASVDSIPTSANQEDHVSMATHGARRLLAMAENCGNVIAIELLAAAQGCDLHTDDQAHLSSSAALERVRKLLRAKVPTLTDDRYFAPDMAAANVLVRSGALTQAVGADLVPTIE